MRWPYAVRVLGFLVGLTSGCGSDSNPLRSRIPPSQICPSCVPVSYVVDLPRDISPDESLIVYAHIGYGVDSSGIYLIGTAPGSIPRFLCPFTDPFWADDPWGLRFSPDGKHIAMVRHLDIFVIDISTGQEWPMTHTGGNAQDGDWDPSGRYLVYSRPGLSPGAPDTSAGIFILDTQTGNDRHLRHDGLPTYGAHPKWSPDSTKIVFWFGTPIHIYTLNVDQTGYRDLTPSAKNFRMDQSWIEGGARVICEVYETSYRAHRTESINALTEEANAWPLDLRLAVSSLTRNGSHYVYPGPDSSGVFSVLYLDDTADVTGERKRQVTFLPQGLTLDRMRTGAISSGRLVDHGRD
jgi:Tol biopolymer transport system component